MKEIIFTLDCRLLHNIRDQQGKGKLLGDVTTTRKHHVPLNPTAYPYKQSLLTMADLVSIFISMPALNGPSPL